MTSIKDKIENNIFSLMFALVIGTVGITYSIINYFNTKEIERERFSYKTEIEQYQKEIASIKRSVNKDNYYDIRSILIKPNQSIPKDATFYPESKFYAIKNNKFFTHQKINAFSFMADLIKKDSPLIEMILGAPKEYAQLFTIDIWKGKDQFNLKGDFDYIKEIPYITVQYVDIPSYNEVMNASLKKDADKIGENNEKVSDFLSVLGMESFGDFMLNNIKSYDSDIVKSTLAQYLAINTIVSSRSKNFTLTMDDIQKTGNVIYLKFIAEYNDVLVNNVHKDKFYGIQELFLIEENNGFYGITINLPSDSPIASNTYNSEVNKWLNNFKIYSK